MNPVNFCLVLFDVLAAHTTGMKIYKNLNEFLYCHLEPLNLHELSCDKHI